MRMNIVNIIHIIFHNTLLIETTGGSTHEVQLGPWKAEAILGKRFSIGLEESIIVRFGGSETCINIPA
jgi:hypothetical protein